MPGGVSSSPEAGGWGRRMRLATWVLGVAPLWPAYARGKVQVSCLWFCLQQAPPLRAPRPSPRQTLLTGPTPFPPSHPKAGPSPTAPVAALHGAGGADWSSLVRSGLTAGLQRSLVPGSDGPPPPSPLSNQASPHKRSRASLDGEGPSPGPAPRSQGVATPSGAGQGRGDGAGYHGVAQYRGAAAGAGEAVLYGASADSPAQLAMSPTSQA